MEVLAGSRDDDQYSRLRQLLLGCDFVGIGGMAGYEEAAMLYRYCRSQGETIRHLTDCLIAVAAIRAGAAILHVDTDFDVLARHSALKIVHL